MCGGCLSLWCSHCFTPTAHSRPSGKTPWRDFVSHSSKMTQLSNAELDSNLDTVVSDSAPYTTELTKKDSLLSD